MDVTLTRGGLYMRGCSCSIFDTREERLIEQDGRIIHRLICNICGRVLDSKVEQEAPVYRRKPKTTEEKESDAVSF